VPPVSETLWLEDSGGSMVQRDFSLFFTDMMRSQLGGVRGERFLQGEQDSERRKGRECLERRKGGGFPLIGSGEKKVWGRVARKGPPRGANKENTRRRRSSGGKKLD